ASRGRVSAVLKRGDVEPRAGTALLLPDLPGVASERVLLVSLGPRAEFGEKAFRDCVSSAARALAGGASRDAAVALADVDMRGRWRAGRLERAARLLADGAYRFDGRRLAGGAATDRERSARRISLLVSGQADEEAERAVRRGLAVAEGMALAKD